MATKKKTAGCKYVTFRKDSKGRKLSKPRRVLLCPKPRKRKARR